MRRFLTNQDGGFAVFAAFAMPAVAGSAAFGIDLGYAYYTHNILNAASDAAALGAVLALPSTASATSRALDLAGKNVTVNFGTVARSSDVEFGIYDPVRRTFGTTSNNPNAVRVTTRRTMQNGNPLRLVFARLLGVQTMDLVSTSTAVRVAPVCALILDPAANQAFYQQGNASLDLSNCPIQVNSSASRALSLQGSAAINAPRICVVGGYEGKGYTTQPRTGCAPMRDPLGNLPEPHEPACVGSVPPGGGSIASNCKYTGTIVLKDKYTLNSGTMYLKGATLKISGGGSLSGAGTTIFLDANSRLDFAGTGSLILSAPKSGIHQGVAIFQSRGASSDVISTLQGTSNFSIDGAIYMPTSTLELSGNGSATSAAKVGRIIVGRLRLTGSAKVTMNAFANQQFLASATNKSAALVR